MNGSVMNGSVMNVVCCEWSVMNGLLWTGLFWTDTASVMLQWSHRKWEGTDRFHHSLVIQVSLTNFSTAMTHPLWQI